MFICVREFTCEIIYISIISSLVFFQYFFLFILYNTLRALLLQDVKNTIIYLFLRKLRKQSTLFNFIIQIFVFAYIISSVLYTTYITGCHVTRGATGHGEAPRICGRT